MRFFEQKIAAWPVNHWSFSPSPKEIRMSELSRKAFLFLALILFAHAGLFALAWAQTAKQTESSAMRPEQAQQSPAGKFVQDLGNEAIGIIVDKSVTEEERNAKYHDILRTAFDLKTIGHFVIGRAWDSAPAEQRQEYMDLFEKLVLKIYGDRLKFYSGESFRVRSVRQESERDFVVGSLVDHPGGAQPTTVDWRVRQEDGKFAIIDVVIDGVSQSVTQRQEYGSIIQRNGGKLDKLLAYMRQRLEGTSEDGSQQ